MSFHQHGHHLWFGIETELPCNAGPCAVRLKSVNHVCSMPLEGEHDVRWIKGGREDRWRSEAGQLTVLPADGAEHVFIVQSSVPCNVFSLLLPVPHLVAGDGPSAVPNARGRIAITDDVTIQDCMRRIAASMRSATKPGTHPTDDTVQTLVGRLQRLLQPTLKQRKQHGSIFDPGTVHQIVDHVDGSLQYGYPLNEIALSLGLSPSHCARKIRDSFGMSLQRFVYRRRVRAAMALLCDPNLSLPAIATRLGFATRSHFSRTFRATTGITPARYRRLCGIATSAIDDEVD